MTSAKRLDDMQEVDILLNAVNAVGVVGVLIFLVVAFYRGELVSRKVIDEIVKAVVAEVLETIKPMIEQDTDALADKVAQRIKSQNRKEWT
jgi:hypothetical protein